VESTKGIFEELCNSKRPNEHADQNLEGYWVTRDGDRRLITWSNSVILDDEGVVEYVIGTGIDITEQKQAEADVVRTSEALAYERDLFHTFMDNTPDRIYFKDTQGRFIRVNRALAEAHGLSDPADVVGKTDADFFAEEEAQQFWIDEQAVMQTGEPMLNKEDREVWLDGRVTWCSTSIVPFRDKEGNGIGVLGVVRDVTERKQWEEALRESEERYRNLVEHLGEGIGIVDVAERFSFANPSAHRIFGVSPGSLVGRNLKDFVDEEGLAVIEGQTAQRQAGEGGVYELEIVPPDGQRRSLLMTTRPQTDQNGQFTGTMGIFRDITERKRAEREVEARRRYLEGVLRAAPDAIVTSDAQQVIMEWNPEAERLFGYSAEEAIGQEVDNLVANPETREEAAGLTQAVMNRKTVGPVEAVRYRKNGTPVDVILSGSPITAGDELIGAVAVYTDITERKKAEREVEARRRYLEGVLRAAPDAIVTLDAEHIVVEWNPGAERLFGYPAEEAIGRNLDDLVTNPDTRDEAARFTRAAMNREYVGPVETKRYRKDGSPVDVILAGSPIAVGNELIGMVSVYTDITARKQAENALRESHERFLTVLDSIDAHIYVADMETHEILYMNKQMRADFGDGLVGKMCWQEFRGDSGPCAHCTNDRLLDADGNPTGVYIWEGQNPITEQWYMNYDRAIKWVDGRLVRLQVATNITERKRVEEALRVQHDLAVALSSASALPEALDRVLEAARQVEGVGCAAIYLIDRFTGAVDIAAHTGLSPEFAERLFHFDANTPQARLVMAGESAYHPFSKIVPDINGWGTDKRMATDGERQTNIEHRTSKDAGGAGKALRAAGVIPVKHEGQVVAALNVASYTCDEFPARTRDVLEAIAASIGSVIARVRAEAALRESQQNLQALFDTLDDFLIIVDAEGRIVHVNPVVEERLGYSVVELSGMNILELHAPECWAEVTTMMADIVAGRTTGCTLLTELIARDGTQIPVETKGTVGHWGDMEVFFGIARDITERMQAEEALRESEEKFRKISASAHDAIIMMDDEGRISFWNEAAEKIFGYLSEEALGQPVHTLIAPEHYREASREGFGRFRTTGQGPAIGKSLELEAIRKDGTIFPIEVSLSATKMGGTWNAIGIIRDVTERKQAEEQLQRYAADLEQANADIERASEDVVRASEDIVAPRVNLKGFAAELRDGLEMVKPAVDMGLPYLDETQRKAATLALHEDVPEALEFIDASVERMDHFINAVLKLSRLGRQELRLELVDVEALVQATLDSLAHQLDERQVAVTVGPLPQVVADRTSMEQIVGNIIGNAVKYLDPERPGELEISAERNHEETAFRVRDNGRGIAEGDMDKVFAPFRRAGTQDVPGEGMGLPYVQTLIRRHGGRIWCESELGVGTTFTFTISNHPTEEGNDV